jgi:hypothetical protein
MKIHRSWFLAAGILVGLMSGGLSGAAADSSRRPSHPFPEHSSLQAAPASRAADGRFFLGHGGAVRGPFLLQGGKYDIDILANYNAGYDAGNSGTCFFTAYLNGVEQPRFVNLGRAVPVLASAPYNATLAVTLSAGHYKLIVSPVSECDWDMTILSHDPSVPSVEIMWAQSYLHSGNTFTPATVAHMGQTFDFSVFYLLAGGLKGKPKGTITFQEHGSPPQSSPLFVGNDINGMKQMFVNATFTIKTHDTPGPAVATFRITLGKFQVSESLHFTVVR